jgi:ribosomal protein L11 methyltransferase
MWIYRLVGTLDNLDPITPDLWDAGCQGLTEDGGAVLAHFATQLELPFGGTWQPADTTDWLAAYRASIAPVNIGRVTITPPWLEPDNASVLEPDNVRIILEPGLAFGTGQHETTHMAIEALQDLPLAGKTVLDVGAGTGILAIVAGKLGARTLGVDNDPSTVGVARENALQNGVHAEFVAGLLKDVLFRAPFDVVVANLFAELHALLMPQYKQALGASGRLILTGILAGTERADAGEQITWDTSSGREVLVLDALQQHGFGLFRRQQRGDWVLLEAVAGSAT